MQRFLLLLAIVPQHVDSSSVTGADCNVDQVTINFYDACANGRVYKNLQGLGPDSGDGDVVRYGKVGTYDGIEFDVVLWLGSGQPTFVPKENSMDTSTGCVPDNYRARIQFANAKHYTFDFEIQRSDDRSPLILPGFTMYFNDLDGAAEWVSPIGASSWTLDSATSLVQETSPLNPTFKATDPTNVPSATDPDPMQWTSVQKAATVAIHFENTADFQIRLEVFARASQHTPASNGDGCFSREDGGGQVCSGRWAGPPAASGFGLTGFGNLGVKCPPLPPALPLPSPPPPSPSPPPPSPPPPSPSPPPPSSPSCLCSKGRENEVRRERERAARCRCQSH